MIKSTVVTNPELLGVRQHAHNAWLNGHSHVRGSDRAQMGEVDQLVGQLGEFALARYLGDEESYFQRRRRIDKTPTVGDDGSDFKDLKIDVKTSLARRSPNPRDYRLLVRPRERHTENVYVLGIVENPEGLFLDAVSHKVYLVGWAYDSDLPAEPHEGGVFDGAFALPARKLREML